MLRGAVACLVVAASIVFSSPRVLGAEPVRLRFDITAYRVEGSTLLTNNQVQSTVAPFRGKQRDFADIQRALEALETAYRKAGFGPVRVFLPEQELQGIVYGARYNFLFARHGEYEHKMVFGTDYRIYDKVYSVGTFGAAGNIAECVLQ